MPREFPWEFSVPRASYRDSASEMDRPLSGWRGWLDDRPQLPYLLPFMAFVLVMAPPTFLGKTGGVDWKGLWQTYQPLLYLLKTLLAALFLFLCWHHYTPIRWTRLTLGAAVGIAGTVIWILVVYGSQMAGISSKPHPADFYNPDLMLHETWQRWGYLVIRVAGPSLVVPLMEELFFRDFLMRALIRGARFQDVAVGTFTWFSFIGVSLLFGLNHGAQWPAGIAYGLLMGFLLIRTKSLGACIVAHGVTNFTLYLYVIYAGDWQFM